MSFRRWVLLTSSLFLFFLVMKSYSMIQAGNIKRGNFHYYFKYSQEELDTLGGESNYLLSKESIDKWDNIMFRIVEDNKLPPTDASRLYTYLLMGQKEFALLTYANSSNFSGSVDFLMRSIICEIVPEECSNIKIITNDEYSEKLGELVFSKLISRILTESNNLVEYERLEGEENWEGNSPVTPDAGSWQAWFIESGDQFRAVPPYEYGSEKDIADLAIVKNAVVNITNDQYQASEYWAGSPGSITPSGIWLSLANQYANERSINFSDYLTMRANLAATMQDAFISCWDTKFTYWTKRPNMRDKEIITSIPTPNFPSYTSGHSTVSAAAAEVLSFYFPEYKDYWMDMAEEARDSRLWSGIHFPQDNDRGFEMGQKIGKYAISLF